MTTPKMTLKKDNPKETPNKKVELPTWPGVQAAELGKQYVNARGNIIQRSKSHG